MKPTIIKTDLKLPFGVKLLSDIFTYHGYELYVVGGAVRDHLSHEPIKDYDLATNALPETVESILNEEKIKTLKTGEQFGVMNAIMDGEEYEIATFREDSLTSDGRRPDYVVFSDIETDVKRRDLTINALFYDIWKKVIVDYVGGVEDIKNGVVRTVGDPKERFAEDKLRILRAIRFTNRIGGVLDPQIDAFLRSGYDFGGVSYERIRDEFLKSIKSAKSVENLFRMYAKYEMFGWIFPNLLFGDDFKMANKDYIVSLAFFLKNNEVCEVKEVLNTLTYTNKEIKDITFLINLLLLTPDNAPKLKEIQKKTSLSKHQIYSFAVMNGLPLDLIKAFVEFELTVKGGDVMKEFNLQGSEISEMVETIEIQNFKNLLNNLFNN